VACNRLDCRWRPTGILAGLFGIGGGAVIIPILYEVFRITCVLEAVRMPLCIGTSLAIIIPTSISSYRAHLSRGAGDTAVLRQWALPTVVGVVVGSLIARIGPEALFKIVFVGVATFNAVRLLFVPDGWRFGDVLPGGFRPASRASTICDAAQIRTCASQIVAMPCSGTGSTRMVTVPARKSIGATRLDFAREKNG
jgi:uncharacterized membrane protein YfcA